MNLTTLSLLGLLGLYVISLITSFIFDIQDNRFYMPFHFLGGFLLTLLFFGITKNPGLAVMLTLLTGISWEIYEYLLWKYFLKKKKFKPQRRDTINDFFLDFLGALLAIFLPLSI